MAHKHSLGIVMPWEVQLLGDISDLEHLSSAFRDQSLRITQVGDDFVLRSTAFEEDMDATSVRAKANELVTLVTGAAKILLRSSSSIRTGWALKQHDSGKRVHHMFPEPAILTIRGGLTTVLIRADGSIKENLPDMPVSEWLNVAAQDSSVRLVLQAIASGPLDWVNMYRIFEIIQSDRGGIEKIHGQTGWPSLASLKLFKHTANSPSAVGFAARHGVQTNLAPQTPMSLVEAEALIRQLISAWMTEKARAAI